MKEFTNFDAFTKHIESNVVKKYREREAKALDVIGEMVELEAKDNIGHLQGAAGDFPDWKELADSTKKDKASKGYVYNSDFNPLYRTGEMKESIHHVVNPNAHKVIIGSADEVALYQELGTATIPSRSFLGLALFTEKQIIVYIIGQFLLNWITNNRSKLRVI